MGGLEGRAGSQSLAQLFGEVGGSRVGDRLTGRGG